MTPSSRKENEMITAIIFKLWTGGTETTIKGWTALMFLLSFMLAVAQDCVLIMFLIRSN